MHLDYLILKIATSLYGISLQLGLALVHHCQPHKDPAQKSVENHHQNLRLH